ncbi:GlxA family transcriptional regulator [Oceanobacter mangrovi]|uniref:GlxA family transcriptional regulator n=1 Tax=Oceanobacter mangrovi TaxID=2862510 RepID=UPI001C8E009A|nr:helix-turn-helix domain-containing protein [Oceanobacter mangrovi]
MLRNSSLTKASPDMTRQIPLPAGLGKPSTAALERTQKVVFVLLEHFSMVSFTGAADVLVTANLLMPAPMFEVKTCCLKGSRVRSDLGVELTVDNDLDSLNSDQIDVLVVCGGYRTPLKQYPALTRLIQHCYQQGARTGGLWNGAYFLAAAGLTDAGALAIHPDSRILIREHFPQVQLSNLPATVDQQIFSCASPDGSINSMLKLLEHLHSIKLKQDVGSILLSNLDHTLAIPLQKSMGRLPLPLMQVIELMENNIEEVLEMVEISTYTQLSRRQIERLFSKHLKTSPAKFYLELRLAKARDLIMKTSYSVSEVAVASGFTSITHFSRAFKSQYGCSPSHMRGEFGGCAVGFR